MQQATQYTSDVEFSPEDASRTELDFLEEITQAVFIVLARKLIVFVAIPYILFRALFGYRWRDFGLQIAGVRALGGNHLPVVLLLSAAILLFQYFLGGGAAPLRRGEFQASQLAIGLPRLFGPVGGLTVGYQEELGWLRGRSDTPLHLRRAAAGGACRPEYADPARHARSHGRRRDDPRGRRAILGAGPQVKKLLEMTRLDSVFENHTDMETAVSSF